MKCVYSAVKTLVFLHHLSIAWSINEATINVSLFSRSQDGKFNKMENSATSKLNGYLSPIGTSNDVEGEIRQVGSWYQPAASIII